LVQEFNELLQAEAEALTAGNDDALAETTSRKNQYAESLANAGKQRNSLLSQLGFESDKVGLQAACKDFPALGAVSAALLEAAERGQRLNAENGIMIDTFLTHNQQMLDALRQLTGAGDLYDAKGRSRPGQGATRNIRA
jgi:flagella synthesis protein FlgN